MKKFLLAAVASTVAFAAAPSAQAAQFLTITGPSGTYGDDAVTCANNGVFCSFTRTFTFTTPVGYNLASSDISSLLTGNNMATNIDFTTVTLNGVNFNNLSSGVQEFRNLLNQTLVAGGVNTLFVSGNVGAAGSTEPADASFSGNLSFATVTAAVPEPATWGLMVVGFGMIGSAARGRKAKTTVRFA
ncbi:FxDxF family PEP-CTERM protein [Sphingomonas sp. GB1N7]|uniref:FxDxF family PEP-CTERM protein n=1 Tax=Parasphingomonas caseinilytica TaxID=3096158 RepID=UPI002FC92969